MKYKTIAQTKLNSIQQMISKSLQDRQITEQEFKKVLDELSKYNDLKDNKHLKPSRVSEEEKKKLIKEGKAQTLNIMKKI